MEEVPVAIKGCISNTRQTKEMIIHLFQKLVFDLKISPLVLMQGILVHIHTLKENKATILL